MTELWDRMLFATVQGVIGLVIAALVCAVFSRMPSSTKSWVWRLAILRFLVALTFEWQAPILPTAPQNTLQIETLALTPMPVIVEPHSTPTWFLVWVVPMFGLFVLGVSRFIKLLLLAHSDRSIDKHIRASEQISVPFVIGFWRGLILLPEVLFRPNRQEELNMAIAHEEAHRARLDPFFGILVFFTMCLFWFVLPMWFAIREYMAQIEMDCDQRALRSKHLSSHQYGGMLVALATTSPNQAGAYSMAGTPWVGKSQLKRRLIAMKTIHPPLRSQSVIGLFVLGALLIVPTRLVSAQTAEKKTESAAINSKANTLAAGGSGSENKTKARRVRLAAIAKTQNDKNRNQSLADMKNGHLDKVISQVIAGNKYYIKLDRKESVTAYLARVKAIEGMKSRSLKLEPIKDANGKIVEYKAGVSRANDTAKEDKPKLQKPSDNAEVKNLNLSELSVVLIDTHTTAKNLNVHSEKGEIVLDGYQCQKALDLMKK